MNHYLVSPTFELQDWGFQYGHTLAPMSLAVVMDQHGDEYTGRRAGAAMARVLAAWGAGKPAHGPWGSWPVPAGFERLRVMVVTTLNPEGFDMGTRQNGAGKDLNRCWSAPDDHVEIERVWDALQELPGHRWLVDVHGTWVDRDGDPEPDSHLYVVPDWAMLFADVFAKAFGHAPIVVATDPEEDLAAGTLEGAALAAGMVACTLELGEDDGRQVAVQGAQFIRHMVDAQLELVNKKAHKVLT